MINSGVGTGSEETGGAACAAGCCGDASDGAVCPVAGTAGPAGHCGDEALGAVGGCATVEADAGGVGLLGADGEIGLSTNVLLGIASKPPGGGKQLRQVTTLVSDVAEELSTRIKSHVAK